MPDGWAYIASFVSDTSAGKGIGHQLFEATKHLARSVGAVAIDATIRADNIPGLGYYSKIGFVDYDRLIAVELSDGRRIDRIRKKFVL
jgi:GNAT superfamily N-acetyltransferase